MDQNFNRHEKNQRDKNLTNTEKAQRKADAEFRYRSHLNREYEELKVILGREYLKSTKLSVIAHAKEVIVELRAEITKLQMRNRSLENEIKQRNNQKIY